MIYVLRATGLLATKVTKWDDVCDLMLNRLVAYMYHTRKYRQVAFCGDAAGDLRPHLFADADLAGDPKTQKSTSGMYFAIIGKHTHCPLIARSSKQTSVADSTPAAELHALHAR